MWYNKRLDIFKRAYATNLIPHKQSRGAAGRIITGSYVTAASTMEAGAQFICFNTAATIYIFPHYNITKNKKKVKYYFKKRKVVAKFATTT